MKRTTKPKKGLNAFEHSSTFEFRRRNKIKLKLFEFHNTLMIYFFEKTNPI